jgi:anti-sigma B factor antagonist
LIHHTGELMMNIDITVSDVQHALVLDVSGSVNSITAIKLGEELQRAAKKGQHNLVIVLHDVDYISSAGLREIMSALQTARGGGGDLRLAAPSKQVAEVLEMTGLDSRIGVFATREDAAQSFA